MPGEDPAAGRVDGHGAEDAAAVAALRHKRRAPLERAVGEPVGRDAPPGGGRLAARARAGQHEPAGDHRRAPEVVVAARRAQRLGLPEQRAVAQAQAPDPVGRHEHAPVVHGAAAEEAERHGPLPRAVDRGLEAAPPALAPVGQVEGRDLAAEGRRDHAVVDDERRAGEPAGDGPAPAHGEAVGRTPRGACRRQVVRRLGPRVADRRRAARRREPLGGERRRDDGERRRLEEGRPPEVHGSPRVSRRRSRPNLSPGSLRHRGPDGAGPSRAPPFDGA